MKDRANFIPVECAESAEGGEGGGGREGAVEGEIIKNECNFR